MGTSRKTVRLASTPPKRHPLYGLSPETTPALSHDCLGFPPNCAGNSAEFAAQLRLWRYLHDAIKEYDKARMAARRPLESPAR